MGLLRNVSRALRRKSSIHAGSFFIEEMRSTISFVRPLADLKTYLSSES